MSLQRGAVVAVAIVAGALLLRAVVAASTVVPSEDGANYLWKAERFAVGDFAAGLSEVFPPLWPLLGAPLIAVGVEPFVALRIVACLCGTAAVVVGARIAQRATPGTFVDALVLGATLGLAARYCGEVYSEPAFLLLGALAVDAGLRDRPWRLGAWAGLAALVRPEGAVIALGFALAHPRRNARALVATFACVALVALWRASLGLGFDLAPKAGFNLAKATFGDELLGIVPAWIEAFGVVGIVALLGWKRVERPARVPLAVVLVLVLVVVVAFVPRRRFLVAFAFVVVPFAAAWTASLPVRVRGLVLTVAAIAGVVSALRVTDVDRLAERDVGRWLASVTAPSDGIVTDLTRVLWYAGRRPLPPRHLNPEELANAAAASTTRFVVLGARRPQTETLRAQLERTMRRLDVTVAFAPEVVARIESRGIAVFERDP